MGVFFVLLGFVTALAIFPSEASIVMVALSSLFILPYVLKIFEYDELNVDIDCTNRAELDAWVRKCLRDGHSPQQIKDNLIRDNMDKPYDLMYDLAGVDEEHLRHMKESNPISRHKTTITFYVYLFLGMTFAYFLLYSAAGEGTASVAFENQVDLIRPGPTGLFSGHSLLWIIIANNLKIMLICVILSLLYGSGAVFILNYNASIAGVLFGGSLRALLWGAGGFIANPLAYLPHTGLEILAYLFAAVCGGILSKATAGSQRGSERILLVDGVMFFVFSILLVLIAGIVEVQVI